MSKKTVLQTVRFRDYFDPEKVVTSPSDTRRNFKKSVKKDPNLSPFDDDGVFSERIFGKESDPENVDIIGWMDFGKDSTFIINPIHFDRLTKIFKKKNKSTLIDMISYNQKIDKFGRVRSLTEEEEVEDFPEKNMGLDQFKAQFLDLMVNFVDPEMKKTMEYRTVLNSYFDDQLFIDCFPIMSTKLRPAQLDLKNNELIFNKLNNDYKFAIRHSNLIKNIKKDINHVVKQDDLNLQILTVQFDLQMDCYRIVKFIINNNLKGKSGALRKIINGSRVNFSARNLILPEPKNDIDEVSMNYQTFAILYEPLLINLVHRVKHLDYNDATQFVKDRENLFDEELYELMNELVHKTEGGMHILLNRNPSIAISSIHRCRIKEIKRDFEDKSISISNNILAGMGADYDGDVLNIIALFSKEQADWFEMIDPKNMTISNNDDKFYKTYDLDKDQAKAVWDLNN